MSSPRSLLKLAFKLSRPRFWFYVTGPFTVGCIWAAKNWMQLWTPEFFFYLFYFLFPANILLYGVNDFYDAETDKINPKKGSKEYLIDDRDRKGIKAILTITLFLSLIMLLLQRDIVERQIFGSFLFLSWFYSAKPIRFKSIPFLDSASNVLFALPGVFAYYQVSGMLPPAIVILAAFLHSFAMHLFSAIPDIQPDKSVGLSTTAVFLGEKASLTLCLLLWAGFAGITISLSSFSIYSFLTLIYPAISIALLFSRIPVDRVYWYYPYINVGLGGLLFILGGIMIPFSSN